MEVLGGSASREFVVTMEAPKADIDRWLESSPGIQDAEVEGSTYKIKPKDAQFAEVVRVADDRVRVRTYWS